MKYRVFLSFAAIVLFSFTVFGQAAVRISTEDEIKADLAGPCTNEERLAAVKALFKKMGAKDDDIKVETFGDANNVVLTKKGLTAETVVIGAHYDKVKDGCGIIDNWSGVVVLAHLYRTYSSFATNKSYIFVAFDKEENGLKGSAAMVKAIPKEQRKNYCSMINLDSFGLGNPYILDDASSPKMVKLFQTLGEENKVPVKVIQLGGAADSDSSSFKNSDIPGITISTLNSKWADYMHTAKDKVGAADANSVLIGYQFGLLFTERVDQGACSMFR